MELNVFFLLSSFFFFMLHYSKNVYHTRITFKQIIGTLTNFLDL